MTDTDRPAAPGELSVLPERVSVGTDVVWHDLDGRVVLLELNIGHYFTLDTVGSSMWRALVECADTDTAAQRLCDEFDVEPSTLRRDLGQLIDKMVDSRLLVAGPGTAHTP